MSGVVHPRDRIEAALIEAELPPSYRVIPGLYLTSALGTSPVDSRFCSKDDGYTVLYASPDFSGIPGAVQNPFWSANPET